MSDMQYLTAADPLLLAVIVLGIVIVIMAAAIFHLHNKLKRFLIGTDSTRIGDSLAYVSGQLSEIQQFKNDLESYLVGVEKRLKKSVRSVHTVRFNPFKGTGGGGNQSFATAFINEEGDGVIISSLYARDHVSIFSKPVRGNKSEHELSDEEKESLENALNGLRG